MAYVNNLREQAFVYFFHLLGESINKIWNNHLANNLVEEERESTMGVSMMYHANYKMLIIRATQIIE